MNLNSQEAKDESYRKARRSKFENMSSAYQHCISTKSCLRYYEMLITARKQSPGLSEHDAKEFQSMKLFDQQLLRKGFSGSLVVSLALILWRFPLRKTQRQSIIFRFSKYFLGLNLLAGIFTGGIFYIFNTIPERHKILMNYDWNQPEYQPTMQDAENILASLGIKKNPDMKEII